MIYLSVLLILVGIFLLMFGYIIIPSNNNYSSEKKGTGKYCVLVPARNESKVIEQLLISLEKQTRKINPHDIYIIVEDPNDLTVSIAKKHKMNIVFRKDLSKRRKGYALDDAIKEILMKHKKYAAYFIFDADNVLDKDFIKEIERAIVKGYDIGIGYRNTKNSNNLVSSASSLTFSMINTLGNERKYKFSNNLTISGTGYYIRGDIIEQWGGFPFHTLTEDYELTLYCILNNLTTAYNTKAIFYDEQPESFKVSITQRSRWIKGYFEARKKYVKEVWNNVNLKSNNWVSKINACIGVWPYIYIIIGIILLLINSFIRLSIGNAIKVTLFVLSFVYLLLVILSYLLISKEKDKLDLKVSKVSLALYNPIFLVSFIICALVALFNKNDDWKPIEHVRNK